MAKTRKPDAAKPAAPGGQVAHSVPQLAAMLGPPYPASARQLSRLLQYETCPFDSNVQDHPVDVAKFRAWYDTHVAPNNPKAAAALGLAGGGVGSTLQRVELQLKYELMQLYRARRERVEERFIPRDEHEKNMRDFVTMCRDRIEQWIDSIPPLLEGLDSAGVAQARITMRDAYDQLCAEMQAITTLPPAQEREPDPPQDPKKSKAAKKRWKSKKP